jgi:CRP-like cAMP-binding protein
MAHLICEVYLLLKTVNLVDEYSFSFAVTQAELGDMLGLSAVHVNRVLQELRAKKLIRWERDEVTILQWEQLQEFGLFEPTYLHLVKEPR